VDYIFTEFFFNLLNTFISVNAHISSVFEAVLFWLSDFLPLLVKYTIGYCHFYYQLGYGLVVYIYLYRRRKAKKSNNWQSFYGNSTLNWVVFNLSIFNKFVFNRNFIIYLKAKLTKTLTVALFWLKNGYQYNTTIVKTFNVLNLLVKSSKLQQWTPLFKRTSYISFMTVLKRFTKRK
jgi:hypothetical protein